MYEIAQQARYRFLVIDKVYKIGVVEDNGRILITKSYLKF